AAGRVEPRSDEPAGLRDTAERRARGHVDRAHGPNGRQLRLARGALLRRSSALRGHRRIESPRLDRPAPTRSEAQDSGNTRCAVSAALIPHAAVTAFRGSPRSAILREDLEG